MILAEDLRFLRRGRTVIRDVSLVVPAGRVTILVGPNGAGKSTLLKLLSGELRPTAGRILYGAVPIGRIPPRTLARRRAVLPQSGGPVFAMTVHELVRLGALASGAADPDTATSVALADAGLHGWDHRGFDRLSGGERQRVQFARALAQVPVPTGPDGPRGLFLDEPTSSLDLAQQVAVLERARAFARAGGAVLAVLHDLNLAAEFADRIAVLRDGALVEAAAPSRRVFERIVADVFDLEGAASRLPPGDVPFVLPQARFGRLPNG